MSLLVSAITAINGAFTDLTATTSAIDTTGAKFLVVMTTSSSGNANSPTLTDSKSNSWTSMTERADGDTRNRIWYCKTSPVVGSGHTFTVSIVADFGRVGLAVMAFSDVVLSQDQEANHSQSPSGIQPGSITPGTNGEILVCLCANTNTNAVAIDSGFTIAQAHVSVLWGQGMALAYKIQSTAAAINPAWTWAGGNATTLTEIASFSTSVGGLHRNGALNGLGAGAGFFFQDPLA